MPVLLKPFFFFFEVQGKGQFTEQRDCPKITQETYNDCAGGSFEFSDLTVKHGEKNRLTSVFKV